MCSDLGLIDVIIIAFVRAPDDHDSEVLARVDTEVIDRRLQEMAIFVQPFGEVERRRERHSEGRSR